MRTISIIVSSLFLVFENSFAALNLDNISLSSLHLHHPLIFQIFSDSNQIKTNYKKAFDLPFTEQKAFNYLFENFDGKKSKWLVDETKVENEVIDFSEGKSLSVSTLLVDSIEIDGLMNYLLITLSTSKNTEKKFLFLVSAYVFLKADSTIFLKISDTYLTFIQSFGEIEQPKIIMAGDKKIGFIIESWYSQMGVSTTFEKIFVEYGNQFSEGIIIESNVSSEDPLWEYDAIYNFSQNNNSEYFDLIIKTKGTEFDYETDKTLKINRTELYRFKDGTYLINE